MRTIRDFLHTRTTQTTRVVGEPKPTPSTMEIPVEGHNLPPLTTMEIPVEGHNLPPLNLTSRLRQFFDRHPWVFYLLVALAVGLIIFGLIMVIVPGRAPSNINENPNRLNHIAEAPKPLQSNTKLHAPQASRSQEVIPSTTSTSAATPSKKAIPATTSTDVPTTSKKAIPATTSADAAMTSKDVKSTLPSTSVTTADCPSPKGSFLDTCKVEGSIYQSTDPNLQSTTMCQYDLHCKKLDGTVQSTRVYVQASMRGCLKFFENCDGNPVLREGNERVCITTEASKRESGIKMEL